MITTPPSTSSRRPSRASALARVLRDSGRLVFANDRLRRVTAAWGLWIVGEAALLVFLSVTAYRRDGTAALAVIGAVRMVPGALATPLLSIVADRVARVRIVTGVFVSWTVLMAALPAALLADSLLPTYLLIGVASLSGTLLRPAISALIPQVIDRPDELAAANSFYAVVEAVGTLLGPLVAGLLVAGTDENAWYFALAALFALGAVISASIRTDFKPAERRTGSGRSRLRETTAGFASLVVPRRMRYLFVVFMAQCATRGALNVLVVAVAVSLIGSGLSSTGTLFAALGAGGVVGALIAMLGTGWRPAIPFVLGMSMWGLPLVLIAAWPTEAVTWAALALVGLGNAIGDINGLTLMHRLVPDHLLGRMFGAFWGTAWASQALGAVIAAPLIDHLGPRSALLAVGITMTAIALLSWFNVRHLDATLAVDDTVVQVLRECVLLAPLTRVALEQLARTASRRDVPDGAVVIEQGAIEDTFYVVESGTLEARVDGVAVRVLGRGECFGEIAAIARSPRTATVVATSAGRLLVLTGDDFVHAVTAHGPAEQTTRTLVRDRLRRASPASGPG